MSLAVPSVARPMQGRHAGIVSRLFADLVDLVVVVGAVLAIYLALSGARLILERDRFDWPDLSALSLGTLGWIVLVAYLAIGWANTGRTLGKSVLGLRVVGARGERLRLWRASLRALLYAVFPIGLLWSIVSARSASLQDLVLGTAVVYDWQPRLPRVRRS